MSNTAASANGFDEAIRYFRNARGLLARCKVRDDLYEDMKPVREAFGTAWLAIDEAIKTGLRGQGLSRREIPKAWDALLAKVVKHLAVRNGKLVRLVHAAHKAVHLEGYYEGAYVTPVMARESLDLGRRVIETLSGRKVG